MSYAEDILTLVSTMKAKGAPFVLATVVRTVSATCAKAGAKAVLGLTVARVVTGLPPANAAPVQLNG